MLKLEKREDYWLNTFDSFERVVHWDNYVEHILGDFFVLGSWLDFHLFLELRLALLDEDELKVDHGSPLTWYKSQIVCHFTQWHFSDLTFLQIDQVDVTLVSDSVQDVRIVDIFITHGETKQEA